MRVRDIIRELPVSRIAEVSALGMGDPAVIPLWYGEGDLPTPAFVGAAATAALQAGHTFYTYKAGLPELRGTIADYLSGLYCRPVGAERILVSSSGMTALMLTAQALIDEGDNLVIVAPVWPNIAAAVTVMGGEPRLVSLDRQPGGGWHLDLERLFAACDSAPAGSSSIRRPTPPDGSSRPRRLRRCSISPAGAACGSSPTRSTPGSFTAIVPRRPSSIRPSPRTG